MLTYSFPLQSFLDRLLRRSVLTAAEQQGVLDLPWRAEQVRSNRDFVRLGEHVDHASLVVSGIVGRFEQTCEGARQITAFHLPGDMADLHSVVQPGSTSALQSLSSAEILRIPHRAIRAAARRHPAIAEALWRDSMVDAAILSQWVVNVGRRDARKRIAHLLCEVATRLGLAPGDGQIRFPFAVTQVQLGDATALTPVHVNRTLQSLRSDGIVELFRREACIHDWEQLTCIADFDPGYLQENVRPAERLRIVAEA